jgi:hypothetical protein
MRLISLDSPPAGRACTSELFAAFAGRLACFRIDEECICPHTRQVYAHEDGVGSFGLIGVRGITLHMEACVGAAIEEWRHRVSLDGAAGPACLAQCQGRASQGQPEDQRENVSLGYPIE